MSHALLNERKQKKVDFPGYILGGGGVSYHSMLYMYFQFSGHVINLYNMI